jgi:chemotaxis signal transduction protein
VEGLVNADGRVIICVALERVFEVLPGESAVDAPRLLVFQSGGWTFAARARQVVGVEEVNFGGLRPLGESAAESLRRSARGVILRNGQAVTCLDAELLVNTLTGLVR